MVRSTTLLFPASKAGDAGLLRACKLRGISNRPRGRGH